LILDLPPIVVEIQHTVDSLFIKKVVNYSLEAFERHKLDPIVLIICTDTLSDCVAKDVKTSDFPACYDFPSTGWACNCLIVCKARVQEYIDTMPLDPFVALSLFLTSWAITINGILYPDDPTIQYLYTLALQRHQSRLGDQHSINMSLPTSLKPGKDLMSKRVVQEPRVINYITEALTKTKNDYFIGNCEWKNGTRSDMVLEPKCSTLDLPPIGSKTSSPCSSKILSCTS
jgi:hypothetical protein